MLTRFSSSVLALGLFLGLSACSTYVEDTASAAFEPVFPTVELASDNTDKSGAIYQQGQSGLFSADRRARKVGDILTVDFNEVFAATKAQSAASSKSDSFELGLPVGLPNLLTGGLANGVGDNSLTSSTEQSFSGSGNAAQSNSLTGRLSVTVVRIFENGNMGILGQKELIKNPWVNLLSLAAVMSVLNGAALTLLNFEGDFLTGVFGYLIGDIAGAFFFLIIALYIYKSIKHLSATIE